MKFRTKILETIDLSVPVVFLHVKDVRRLQCTAGQQLLLQSAHWQACVTIASTTERALASPGVVGIPVHAVGPRPTPIPATVELVPRGVPQSLSTIKKKIDGKELTAGEITSVIRDIAEGRIQREEAAGYVVGNFMAGMTDTEIVAQTHAIAREGLQGHLHVPKNIPMVDLHCIGGIAGNRTSLIVVPIWLAAGMYVPKTSSRAITSPAGTADTMEVFCPVSFPMIKLAKVVTQAHGCIVWGGGELCLAPADDNIIVLEHPFHLDAESQMISSILAKKQTLGIRRLFLDIPYGPEAKVTTKRDAVRLGERFRRIGKRVGLAVDILTTPAQGPIGRGIGPVWEAQDCLALLRGSQQSYDLREKSLYLAGYGLEATGMVAKGTGMDVARYLLDSGKALAAFETMVYAQGGKIPKKFPEARHQLIVRSHRSGTIESISNQQTVQIARSLGAPLSKTAGLQFQVAPEDIVKRGDVLVICSSNHHQLLAAYTETTLVEKLFKFR